jgi:hypothetical protein
MGSEKITRVLRSIRFESDEARRIYCLEIAFRMYAVDQSATVMGWADKIEKYLSGERGALVT